MSEPRIESDFPGKAAHIQRAGERLVIETVRKRDLIALLAILDPLEEEFPDVDADLGQAREIEVSATSATALRVRATHGVVSRLLRRYARAATSRTLRAIAAMPLPRLVDSASSSPRSFRNAGSVAAISAGVRPE